eukprot:m.297788 g.297788  ORF g.297788 m.297788 type:complete len:60 (+) comp40776_c0_seq3:2354-2533(+)
MQGLGLLKEQVSHFVCTPGGPASAPSALLSLVKENAAFEASALMRALALNLKAKEFFTF